MVDEVMRQGAAELAGQILEKRREKPQVAEGMPKLSRSWPKAGAMASYSPEDP